jgi:hypothetical protein
LRDALAVLLLVAAGALFAARRTPKEPVDAPGPVADKPSGTVSDPAP